MHAGGAERVVSFIATNIDKTKFDVKLIVLMTDDLVAYDVRDIDVKFLNKSRLLTSIFSLFSIIKEEKPNIVFSSIGHINIAMGIFSIYFKQIKFIAREASVISAMREHSNIKGNWFLNLSKYAYKKLDKIVCQSKDMQEDIIAQLGIGLDRLVIINNPLTKLEKYPFKEYDNKRINFITIGRLSKEKGHLRILESLSRIKNYYFNYTIIGTGPLEIDLKKQTEKLGLKSRVNYIPYTDEVLKHLSESDYFLQGSYVEGFPNAVLESCSVGTPVIAFNAPGGTKEIIENNINGYLCDKEDDFNLILMKLNELDYFDREEMIYSVNKRFDKDRILKTYEDLFIKI